MPLRESEGLDSEAVKEVMVGPGGELRATREARGLSLEEVAQQMRLSVAQITALEADDYAHLPPPIYVCGYLRAYARLLGIQPEPLIAAYQQLGVDTSPPISTVDPIKQKENSTTSAHVDSKSKTKPQTLRWVAYGGVVLVMGLVYVTLLNRNFIGQDEQQIGEAVNVPVPELAETMGEENPVLEEPLNMSENIAPVQEISATPLMQVQASPAMSSPGPATQPSAATSPNLPAGTVVSDQAKVRIVLTAGADSWVEVTDATGMRLYYDILKPGNTQKLEGVPPLEVLLGYAAGVKVEYNGAPYDKFRVSKEGVAHFKLGKPAGQGN